ncbi:MAG: N-6 DNA methylase [Phycisphaerales bacterium]|nr:N-6 DNA methylase [Phycisphaerales bacterium]
MLGQVFTPPTVAAWMTAWACARQPKRILEPSVGEGVFVDAIERQLLDQPGWRPRVDAHEVDEALRRKLLATRRDVELRLSATDFVLDNSTRGYDACVANPPYVRHHSLRYDEATYRRFDALVGERISRMTNLYGLFLLRIWERLADDGRAAVIVPAEWLNADFGRPLKRFLLSENAIDGVVFFEDDALVFDGALTTAVILLLRRGRRNAEPIRTAVLQDAAALSQLRFDNMRAVDAATLDPARKWSNLLANPGSDRESPEATGTLADVAICMRGIATGANDYFTLTEPQRIEAGLDMSDLKPCITKANHAPTNDFGSSDLEKLRAAAQKAWLLDPREPVCEAVERYLARGRARGIHERYLPSHRPVWYRPEKRAAAPIWAPVFVRGRFRFIRNSARAMNLTAFHGLYPRRADLLSIDLLLEYLWSDAAQRAISAQSRIYGGGLRKLEPRDVLAIPIPESLLATLGDY